MIVEIVGLGVWLFYFDFVNLFAFSINVRHHMDIFNIFPFVQHHFCKL